MTSPPATVDRLLEQAAALAPAQRRDFLERAANGDRELIAEVERRPELLPAPEGFLEAAPGVPPPLGAADGPNRVRGRGERMRLWILVHPLGAGGMGSVHLAERADGAFEKQVAIKLIRTDLGSAALRRRFLTERQALAALEHPNIARLLDGGSTEGGAPYLAMEYVEGGRQIDEACRREGLAEREVLRHFLSVCDAVQYAHSRLVVHRDLKPSNVLLDRDGRIKLVDFGIAKLLQEETRAAVTAPRASSGAPAETLAGPRPLTPAYASPEQLRGESGGIATDVYSLGMLLHVVLAGELPPRQGEAGTRVLLDGDLAWITRRALAEDPRQRYPTVAHLAQDVERHLSHHPVSAAPASLGRRARLFHRRHRLAVSLAAAIVLALLTAAIVSTRSYFAADRARVRAETERKAAEQVSEFLATVLGSIDPNVAQGRDVSVLAEVIQQAARRIPRELEEQPEVAARLHRTLGTAYRRLARYSEAEGQLRRAIELQRSIGSPDAATRIELGRVLLDQARHDEADEWLTRTVEIAEAEHGADSVQRAAALVAHGEAAGLLGQSDRARQLLSAAVEILRVAGSEHEQALAGALGELGWQLATDHRADEAEPLMREALALRRRHAASEPLDLLAGLERLGYTLRVQGELDESLDLYREQVDLARRLLGPHHPHYGLALSHLGALHEVRGEHDAAQQRYLAALEVQQAALGEGHREVATTRNNLGGLYRKMGRFDDAAQEFGAAAAIYREVFGDQHPWVAIVLQNLAYASFRAGDWTLAERQLSEYLQAAARHWPAGHWQIVWFEGMRGAVLFELGRREQGERLLRDSWDSLRRDLGAEDRRVDELRALLAAIYERSGRADERRRLLAESPGSGED